LFPFELASLVLLVSAVGAVVLARRRRGLEDIDEREELRFHPARPAYTGTMAEATGHVPMQPPESAGNGNGNGHAPEPEPEPEPVGEPQ
jgi:NADH-quinone oxidoreductase subunit J